MELFLIGIMFVGLGICVFQIRKIRRDDSGRGQSPVDPPVIQPPLGKTPRDIGRDLMDEHERRYHGR